jgi:hypothetical protein
MPDAQPQPDPSQGPAETPVEGVADRVRAAAPGLTQLVARAEAAQRSRAVAEAERGAPRWTDVFTTQFTEFSNRPR